MQRASLILLFSSNTLGLLQDPQSSKILTNQIASNTYHSSGIPQSSNSNQGSVFFKLLISSNLVPAPPRSLLLENPHSSKILNHQVANSYHRLDSSRILNHQTSTKALSFSNSLYPPISSLLLKDPHFSKILSHQVANNASPFQNPPILYRSLLFSKITVPSKLLISRKSTFHFDSPFHLTLCNQSHFVLCKQ